VSDNSDSSEIEQPFVVVNVAATAPHNFRTRTTTQKQVQISTFETVLRPILKQQDVLTSLTVFRIYTEATGLATAFLGSRFLSREIFSSSRFTHFEAIGDRRRQQT
jgi:hypothetical protein